MGFPLKFIHGPYPHMQPWCLGKTGRQVCDPPTQFWSIPAHMPSILGGYHYSSPLQGNLSSCWGNKGHIPHIWSLKGCVGLMAEESWSLFFNKRAPRGIFQFPFFYSLLVSLVTLLTKNDYEQITDNDVTYGQWHCPLYPTCLFTNTSQLKIYHCRLCCGRWLSQHL